MKSTLILPVYTCSILKQLWVPVEMYDIIKADYRVIINPENS